jgi:hypothetical protein
MSVRCDKNKMCIKDKCAFGGNIEEVFDGHCPLQHYSFIICQKIKRIEEAMEEIQSQHNATQ